MVIAALLLVCAEQRRCDEIAEARGIEEERIVVGRRRDIFRQRGEEGRVGLARHQCRGDGVEGDVRPQQDREALGLKPRARALPFGVGEGVGPRDHGDDVADVERDHMVLQIGGRHAGPLQRLGCDRDQAIEFAAVAVRHRTSAIPTAARRASARGRSRPTPPRCRAGSPSASVRRRRSRPRCRSARSGPGRSDRTNG